MRIPARRATQQWKLIATGAMAVLSLIHIVNVPPTGWYYAELGHFLSCIRAGKPSPLVPRERILAVLGLLETALEADGSN